MPSLGKMDGKAWVFEEGPLDVDWEICAFEVLRELRAKGIDTNYEELGKYCMVNVDPDFPKKVQKGDFLVAGENMGYGHDHDHACMSIKGSGVGAVICESTNANFLRNSFDHGLAIVEIPDVLKKVHQGDNLELDLAAGTLKNLTTEEEITFTPVPDFLIDQIQSGGLYQYLAGQIKAGKA